MGDGVRTRESVGACARVGVCVCVSYLNSSVYVQMFVYYFYTCMRISV